MDTDHGERDGRVPLPGFGGPGWDDSTDSAHPAGRADPNPAGRPGARSEGIRHARRVSNWTAAALIAGTGAAAVALAHHGVPAGRPAAPTQAAGTTGAGAAAGAHGATGPKVTHSVTTTSPSGVTVTTTTTRTVGGKTVVTRVRHVPAYTDN